MRIVRALPLVLLVAAVPAFAAPSDRAYAAFDRSVAATKAAMMRDPQAALTTARQSLRVAEALPPGPRSDMARATAKWLEAEALLFTNESAQAGPIIDEALAIVRREAPGSKLAGDLMRSRGAIAAMGGRVQEALADFQAAYRIFVRAGELRSQAIALQDIGEIYLDAGDYERVLRYYARSAETFRGDPYLLLTTHNNRAQVFREMKRYGEAVAEYRLALGDARRVGSPLLETRILTNLAASLVDAGRPAEAQGIAARAQRLSATGEARGWAPFVAGVEAKIAAARGDDAAAAKLLATVFAGADLRRTAMPYREFHNLAAQVYERLGDERASLAHLKAFTRLDNEARALTASTSAQLVSARFDFTSQNLRIAQLKQGQLTRDIQIERQRSRYRTILFGGLLAAGAIVFALLMFGYLSLRRSRNQVRAANEDLTTTNAKLADALAAKSEFLAMTSHEIRTPLNGILGMTQVLLARRGVDAETRDQVAVVQTAGEAMKAIVDDILDVAKMERGEVTLDLTETDLAGLLDDVANLWRGPAALKGIELTLDRHAAPARVVADAARLRQILANLVSNAVKFTRSGVVSIVVEAGERLVIRVADTGIGIAPEHHATVFESFRQVDAATTREFGGTGLGLAICHRLVTAMGGTIGLESAPGVGSTFAVDLPLCLASAPSEPAADRSGRLLVIEPNLLRQSMLRTLLTPRLGEPLIVDSRDAAFAALEAGGIGRVLCDVEAVFHSDANGTLDFADLAARGGAETVVIHAAGVVWGRPLPPHVIALAKPIDAATLVDALDPANRLAKAA